MANNKVQLADGTTLIDLTEDTVTADDLLLGVTAHARNGEKITGVCSKYDLADTGTFYVSRYVTTGYVTSSGNWLSVSVPVRLKSDLLNRVSATINTSSILFPGDGTRETPFTGECVIENISSISAFLSLRFQNQHAASNIATVYIIDLRISVT